MDFYPVSLQPKILEVKQMERYDFTVSQILKLLHVELRRLSFLVLLAKLSKLQSNFLDYSDLSARSGCSALQWMEQEILKRWQTKPVDIYCIIEIGNSSSLASSLT